MKLAVNGFRTEGRGGTMAIRCPVCGWRFGSEKSLQRHLAAHHSEEEQRLGSQPPETSPAPPPGDGHPGWYPNPDAEGTRYWDGTEWVNWTSTDPNEAKREVGTVQLVLSYVAALVFPIAGLLAGVWLLVRRHTGHGVAVLLITIVWGVGGALLLPSLQSSSAPNSPSHAQGAVVKCGNLYKILGVGFCHHHKGS